LDNDINYSKLSKTQEVGYELSHPYNTASEITHNSVIPQVIKKGKYNSNCPAFEYFSEHVSGTAVSSIQIDTDTNAKILY